MDRLNNYELNNYQSDTYKLDTNYIKNLNNHLQNLKNNSTSAFNDLNTLETLLKEIKIYNNRGYDINNIEQTIISQNNNITLCLKEVYNNIKHIDNKFTHQTVNLNNTTNSIIRNNKKNKCSWCCCFFKL
jgi:2C-methyl-D-erythritol 2,4-cyclodiphosphate synthase